MDKNDKKKKNSKRDDVERYVISSLKDPQSFQIIKEEGIDKVFFTPGRNREIYRICVEYYEKHKSVLTSKVLAHQVSHLEFTQQQATNLHSTFKFIRAIDTDIVDLPYFCGVLKDFHAKSSLKNIVSNALELAKEGGTDANIEALKLVGEEVVKVNDSLLNRDVHIEITSLRDMEVLIKNELINRRLHPEKYAGITTGVAEVDKALGAGMRVGELTMFMAPPSGGKTTTMISLADAIFRNMKKNVVYISLEMENSRIAMKHLANNAIFSTNKLEKADINSRAKEDIDNAFESRRQILDCGAEFEYAYIAGSGRVDISYIEEAVKRILANHHIDVLFVDYVECLKSGGKADHWIEMGDICKALRGMGGRYGFTTVSAVQMKREAISRMRKTKDSELDFGADDAQGSNQISADCDRIYALILDRKDKRRMHMYSAKDRYGDKSYSCSLFFDGECSRLYGDETQYDHSELTDSDGLDDIINMSNSMPSPNEDFIDSDDSDDSILDYRDEVDYDDSDDEDFEFE